MVPNFCLISRAPFTAQFSCPYHLNRSLRLSATLGRVSASKLFGQESGSSSLTGKARAIGDDGKPVKEWNYLDRFYRRYNKVLLDKLAIAKEKERLERENHDLQAILKQYLDGISVNEDVMRGPNPLLVVNGRVNLNAPPVRRTGRVPVVEGNHMLSTHRVATS